MTTNRSFQTCFSTLGCPGLDLAGVLALAAKHQIDSVELRSLADRIDLPDYLAAQPGGLPAVRTSLGELRGGVPVLGTSFKLVGGTEAGRAELLKFARLAEQIGSPYLRIFGGGKWDTELTDADYTEAIGFLNWWNEERVREGWNVDVLIETHDAFSASAPLVRLFDLLGRPVGIIWDSHHTWKLGGETPAESWQQLGAVTRHVHIKDSVSVASARHPYTYVLPGTGEMPAREVLDILRTQNFQGAVALEWEKMWHPYLCDLSDALGACRTATWW
jgi:sugar phosphate isomerase/epimerase